MTKQQEDLYKILMVDPSADPEVITAAYRRLAVKYHPDTNPSPDALPRMQRINEAYSVLSDPQSRAVYDRSRGNGSVYHRPAANPMNQRSEERTVQEAEAAYARAKRTAEDTWKRSIRDAEIEHDRAVREAEDALNRAKRMAEESFKRAQRESDIERDRALREAEDALNRVKRTTQMPSTKAQSTD